MKKRTLLSLVMLVLCLNGLLFAQAVPEAPAQTTQSVPLLVYSGAGLKKAMQEIKGVYEQEHAVDIQYIYAGSAQLISQIALAQKGDVFIVGSEKVYEVAVDKGYANEPSLVAHHTPCIAVASDNPKHIASLEDLAKEGITVILGDPKANAIGLSAQEIIKKNNLPGIEANTVSRTATVNEIVTQITMGQADAGIVTADSIHGNPKLMMIPIPAEQNIDQIIPIGTLTMSEHSEEAAAFVAFVCSQEGKAIFANHGFAPAQ